MGSNEKIPVKEEKESQTLKTAIENDDWASFRDDEIIQQQDAIHAEAAENTPYVGDKQPLSALAAEYQSGSPVIQDKIKVLGESFAAIRRTRGDGNCFFRCFMFAYLEHILESQDKAEVDRIKDNVEQCKKTLMNLGHAEFTFEDFFALFIEQLESVVQGNEASISYDELLNRSRDQSISNYVVMFFRFVTSGEIRRRAEFFEPFILGLSNMTVEKVIADHLQGEFVFDPAETLSSANFCKASVEPMGEESDHVHITALSDALGVPIRVMYLDRSSCDASGTSVNHHDFIPLKDDTINATSTSPGSVKPVMTLLYRPGHYDILYPK